MAPEADCGLSTVLEALCVTSTTRFPVPANCRATRPSATAPRRLKLPGGGFKLRDVKSEIRNPKSEIHRGGEARYTRAHENW